MLTYRATIPGRCTAHLRHLSALLRGHRRTIGCRMAQRAIDLLAATAPDPDTALAMPAGTQVTILDGTVIATYRVRCVSDNKPGTGPDFHTMPGNG